MKVFYDGIKVFYDEDSWNGESYQESWIFRNNETWQKPIEMGELVPIYASEPDENEDYELLGIAFNEGYGIDISKNEVEYTKLEFEKVW